MKIAVAHDWLNRYGGGEVVVEAIHELYPDAPVYTSLYAPAYMPAFYQEWDIRTSFMQRVPGVNRYFRALLPLFPIAFENFDLTEYDLILSSTSAWALGVVPGPDTIHICYFHAPMRYVRGFYYETARRFPGLLRVPLALVIHYLRIWDIACAHRVDHFVANSRYVARKIQKYYGRSAKVIHPPVDTEYFTPIDEDGGYYLVVSRLRPRKRIDIAIEACNRLGLPLKIIGAGSERKRLEAMAGPTVELLGFIPHSQLRPYVARCRGLIQTSMEDFGIAPIEAQATGRPVVAYGAGGALETVVNGQTGLLFPEQTAEGLMEVLEHMELLSFDKEVIRAHAMGFSRARFLREYSSFVSSKVAEAQRGLHGGNGLSEDRGEQGSGAVPLDFEGREPIAFGGQVELDPASDKGDQGG